MTSPLLDRVDAYLDAVACVVADAETVGPFTLFLNRDRESWPYYARPARAHAPIAVADVAAVRARQREVGVAETFEWVHDVTPTLADVAAAAGLVVERRPLLVLERGRLADPAGLPLPSGVTCRLVPPGDPAVLAGALVAELGFAAGGTSVGDAGPEQLAARLARTTDADAARVARTDRRLAADLMVQAVAERDGVVLAVGWHQPVGDVRDAAGRTFAATEIVGVATLPAARRAGLGAAVTALLAADAVDRSCDVVLLSAGDDDVARVYERVGFARVGQVGEAQPAPAPEC